MTSSNIRRSLRSQRDSMEPFQDDLERLVWIFEQFASHQQHLVDRPRIRRALEESAYALDEPLDGGWWTWVSNAARSLEETCKIIDCSTDQLLQIVRDGGRVVLNLNGEWLAIAASHRRAFLVFHPLSKDTSQWIGQKKLLQMLREAENIHAVRCVVFEPELASSDLRGTETKEVTPFNRLWALLRPEWSDIWMIIVFAMVTGLLALATPLAVETLVNTVAFGRMLQPVVILALMLFTFLAFSAAMRGLQTYVVEIIQRRLFARISGDLAFRLPRVEASAWEGHDARELVNRFFDVITVQKISAQLLLDGISVVLGGIIGMSVLAFYHPFLLGFDLILIGLIAFVILVLGRGAVQTSIKESKSKYNMAAWLETLVQHPTSFRYYGAPEFAFDRADRLTYDYLKYRKAHFHIVMRQIVFALGVQAVASTLLLGLGGWLVISGQLTLGQLVASELIVTVIVGSFAKLGKHMESYYDLLAAVDKLGVLFDLPIERQDGLLSAGPPGAVEISLQNLTHFTSDGVPVFENFDLEVEPGERLILTGPSGSGKSLLMDFLYGTREPNLGNIAINGLDPRDLRPDALRRKVVLVRDVEMIPGTISENVHLERPDVTSYDVREAIEKVGLLTAIQNLSKGLETEIDERGQPLTSNQARRLALARAIVGRPGLLLIDGLIDTMPDDEAEKLMAMLTSPGQSWTLVVVTGRQSLTRFGTHICRLSSESGPKRLEVSNVS